MVLLDWHYVGKILANFSEHLRPVMKPRLRFAGNIGESRVPSGIIVK